MRRGQRLFSLLLALALCLSLLPVGALAEEEASGEAAELIEETAEPVEEAAEVAESADEATEAEEEPTPSEALEDELEASEELADEPAENDTEEENLDEAAPDEIEISDAEELLLDGGWPYEYDITKTSSSEIAEMKNTVLTKQNFSGTGKSASQVWDYIYHYICGSSFAAIGGGKFNYPNSGNYTYSVTDGTYKASVTGSTGCMAYCYYVSKVIYGKEGNSKGAAIPTAASLKTLLETYGQAGDHIRTDSEHSVTFIACASDGKGFYGLGYDGDTSSGGAGKISLTRFSYSALANSCQSKNKKLWLYDANTNTNTTTSTNYIDQCTYYPSYLTVRTTGSTPMNSYPISATTDAGAAAGSKTVYTASAGEVFTVTGMYMNTYGNLWYKTQANGTTCYLVASKTEVVDRLYSDVTVSGVTVPGTWKKGTSFYIAGTVKATNNQFVRLDGYILQGSTQKYHTNSGTVSTKSYDLKNSNVDDGLIFSECAVGSYTYRVTAQVKNHYSANSEGKTVASETKTITVIDSPFTISTSGKTTGTSLSNYYIDVNGCLDGVDNGKLTGYGTVDVYINGTLVADDVDDYYVQWPTGTKYEIKDIKPTGGYVYDGLKEGALSGTVGSAAVNIRLKIGTPQRTITYTYNANGGAGAPASQSAPFGTSITIPGTIPTRERCTFLGWSCSQYVLEHPFDADCVQFQPGDSCTMVDMASDELMLIAVWKPNTYTVTYDANGGTGAPAAQTKMHGTVLTLTSAQPTRTGYTFLGWSTSKTATAAAYLPGSNYMTDANVGFYAVWQMDVPADSGELRLTVSNGTASPGGEVELTVSLKNNPGIGGITCGVSYDTSVLELKSIEGQISGGTWSNSVDAGGSVIQWYDTAEYAGQTLAVLTFKVRDGGEMGTSQVTLSFGEWDGVADVNGTSIKGYTIIPGTVTIATYKPGDINSDGSINIADVVRLAQYIRLRGVGVDVVKQATDVNGDGSTNIADVVRLAQYIRLRGVDVEIH